ncbi:MAG: sigma-70 family RNA polymerase sigma factor [Synechococcus sp.]|nr:sigma-70 family RNA polymerase sigma factor [Synechococcus sp.]
MSDQAKANKRTTIGCSNHVFHQRNTRVNQYRSLVTPIAVHYGRRCPETIDDLVQVGLLGLLRAAELFDATTLTPFEAFAKPHIRGAILHYLRDSALAVRLPRRQMELQDKLRQVRAEWASSKGCNGSSEDLRQALELTHAQWQDLQRGLAMGRPLGLEGTVEECWAAHALQPESRSADQMAQEQLQEQQRVLKCQLSRLDPDIRRVIHQVVIAGWSYRRTAALLKVSPMTVQRRLKRGLAELRQGFSHSGLQHPVASATPAC